MIFYTSFSIFFSVFLKLSALLRREVVEDIIGFDLVLILDLSVGYVV